MKFRFYFIPFMVCSVIAASRPGIKKQNVSPIVFKIINRFLLSLDFEEKLEILSRARILKLGLKFQSEHEHEIYNTIFRQLHLN
jgi:hypothetical protein